MSQLAGQFKPTAAGQLKATAGPEPRLAVQDTGPKKMMRMEEENAAGGPRGRRQEGFLERRRRRRRMFRRRSQRSSDASEKRVNPPLLKIPPFKGTLMVKPEYPIIEKRDYPVTPVKDYPLTPVKDYPMTAVKDYPMTVVKDYPITAVKDYPVTAVKDYPLCTAAEPCKSFLSHILENQRNCAEIESALIKTIAAMKGETAAPGKKSETGAQPSNEAIPMGYSAQPATKDKACGAISSAVRELCDPLTPKGETYVCGTRPFYVEPKQRPFHLPMTKEEEKKTGQQVQFIFYLFISIYS